LKVALSAINQPIIFTEQRLNLIQMVETMACALIGCIYCPRVNIYIGCILCIGGYDQSGYGQAATYGAGSYTSGYSQAGYDQSGYGDAGYGGGYSHGMYFIKNIYSQGWRYIIK